MKKVFSVFLCFIMVLGIITSVPVTVNAASVEDLTFELNNEGTGYLVTDCESSAAGEMIIPDTYNDLTVVGIAGTAFADCKSIQSVVIPDSVTSIGNYAFGGCTSLTTIEIPANVTSISGNAFGNCTSLVSITVNAANAEYSSDNGVLFDKTGETIVIYPCGKTEQQYIIPSNVTIIGNSAFYSCQNLVSVIIPESVNDIDDLAFDGCESLTSIIIPEGVTRIGNCAFQGCSNLASVIIPVSVTSIGYLCFYDCQNLKYVFYSGAEADWNNVSIGFSDSSLDNAKFHYESVGHTESDWITDQKATVNEAGKKHKECTVCGDTLENAILKQLKCAKTKLKTITNTASGVKLTWSKVSGADSYEVYRKVKGGSYSKVGATSKTNFTDKKAKSGKQYYYVVKAVNEAGKSANSNYKTIKYLADPTLKIPTSTKSGITLKWSKVTGAQGYIIYRKTGSGSYSKLTGVKGVSKVSYVDKSAKKGKKYTYKVKAYYGKTYSAYSKTKTIKDKY